jgi:elongation factor Ts
LPALRKSLFARQKRALLAPTFRELVKDITLHIAAAHPLYVSRDQVPQESIERERDIFRAQVKGKPEPVINKIVEGKLEKYFATICLLDQAFIKNPDQTIRELVSSKIAELGENIVVRRFARYAVGEDAAAERSAPAEEAVTP